MELAVTHRFDHPTGAVWAMFTDPASHVAKFEGMGHRDLEVLETSFEDGVFRIRISRVVEVELPGFARKALKPTNTVITTDTWRDRGDGSYGGEYVVETVGAPVEASGTTSLRPDGDGTRYDVAVRFAVKVPLLGGRITDFFKGDVRSQIEQEFAAGDAWLAAHTS
jgi:hypothetical protein